MVTAIPHDVEGMPDTLRHDPVAGHLHVGDGVVENVPAAVWAYEVSGVKVLPKWFSYRRRTRERPTMGRRVSPLGRVHARTWLPEYTSDLVDLLHVLALLVDLEPAQAELLDAVVAGPLVTSDEIAPGASSRSTSARATEDHTIALIDIDGEPATDCRVGGADHPREHRPAAVT